jgi:GntR family transcriptional regulator
MDLNRISGVPFYRQLGEYLKEQIEGGEYHPGDLLPSEAELMSKYSLSRTTVRLAFDLVERSGLIRRERGRGTIVNPPALTGRLQPLASFTEDVERLGRAPGTRLLESDLIIPPRKIANLLKLAGDTPIRMIVRLRTADNVPIGFAVTWLNTIAFPQLLSLDLGALSLYQLYENALNVTITRALEQVRADGASESEAATLGIKPGQPVLRTHRSTFGTLTTGEEVAIEYVEATFVGSMYFVESELFRRSLSS